MTTPLVDEARRLLRKQRAVQDGRDQSVVYLIGNSTLELNRIAAQSASEGVRQIIAIRSERINPDEFESELWRDVALAGVSVKRIYLIPHAGFASRMLQEQMTKDSAAGISVAAVVLSRASFGDDTVSSEDLWIIDGNTVVVAQRDTSSSRYGSAGWIVSSRSSDVDAAQHKWERLSGVSKDVLDSARSLDLEEPLVLTADIVSGVAPVLCSGDHVDDMGCAWYHGAWQYLRLLQLVSTPTWHHEFYLNHLVESLRSDSCKHALITGTADYSMFAYLVEAARRCESSTTFTVVDLCPTPLFACRWYAKRAGVDVTVREVDVNEFSLGHRGAFDLLCSDAFLTRFPEDAVLRTLNAWRKLLRPGGSLVTTVRIHDRAEGIRNPEAAVRDFRDRAEQRAARWEPFLRASPSDIADLAEVYARKMTSHKLGDEQTVRNLIEHSGFEIIASELGRVPGELVPTVYLRLRCKVPEA